MSEEISLNDVTQNVAPLKAFYFVQVCKNNKFTIFVVQFVLLMFSFLSSWKQNQIGKKKVAFVQGMDITVQEDPPLDACTCALVRSVAPLLDRGISSCMWSNNVK